MNVLYETKASATGGRAGHVKSHDGVIDLQLAVPKGLGGPGGDLANPETLFASGYSACFHSAVAHVAAQRKVRLGDTRIDVTVGIGTTDDGGFKLQAKIEGSIDGIDPDEAKSIIEEAHTVCPYSKAIKGNIDVELKVV